MPGRFGLIAAASLLIDYVMTVSVSTASAIAQIQSVIPGAYDIRIEIAFVSIGLITVANLRGLRESGNIFAIPTYLFVGLALGIIAIGVFHIVSGTVTPFPVPDDVVPFGTEAVGVVTADGWCIAVGSEEDHCGGVEVAHFDCLRLGRELHRVHGACNQRRVLAPTDCVCRHPVSPFSRSRSSTSWLSKIICGVIFYERPTGMRSCVASAVDSDGQGSIPSKAPHSWFGAH